MATQHTPLECGCEILVYGDGSTPEVVPCHLHNAAQDLKDALVFLKKKVTGPSICVHCDEPDQWNPDCVNLFLANKAIAKSEGKDYVSEIAKGQVTEC